MKNAPKIFDLEDEEDLPFACRINVKFAWNCHLLQPLIKSIIGQEFIMPIICGFYDCQRMEINDQEFYFGILSRRSKFCAGARFLKRGLDKNGNVANEVETELFVYKIEPFTTKLQKFSSYLFVKKN